MDFSTDHHRVGPVEVIQTNGELDANTGDLRIICAGATFADVRHLVVDLGRCTFVDCPGLSAMLTVECSARGAGGWARAVGVQGLTTPLFDVFDVGGVLGGRPPVHLEVRRAFRAAAAIVSLNPAAPPSSAMFAMSDASTVSASGE